MASSIPVCRPYSEGDERAINLAFEKAFGVKRSLEEWAWKFPPGADGRAIMLTEKDGTVVAHCAGMPVNFSTDGNPRRAAKIVDIFCHPLNHSGSDGRGALKQTIVTFYREYGRSGGFSLIYGFPGLHHSRFESVDSGDDAHLVQPIAAYVRKPPSPSSWHRLLYRAEPARDWEPRLDDLWRRVCHDYPVAAVRDAKHALYRLAGRPSIRYNRFLVFPRNTSRAVAFVAFRSDGGCCRWVDLLWDHRHTGALRLLSYLSAKIARQTNAETEEMWLNGDPRGRAHLEAMGFQKVDDSGLPVMAVRAFDDDLNSESLARQIYVTMADADHV